MCIRIQKAEAENFSMNYFTFGNGEKSFVILPGLSVQSVMGAADLIAGAYEIIAKEFTVYVFDRINELPASYSVYDMADDTAKVFYTLGLKNVYVFGASQGGMMAMAIAVKYPDLVEKLMLGSSTARVTENYYNDISKWIDLARDKNGCALSLEMGRALYPKEMFEKYKELLKKTGENTAPEDLKRFIILAGAMKGFDISDELIKIKCPVLSLGAADDTVFPGAAQELERLFSGKTDFESYIYNGYAHAAFDTAPDYKERLLNFMIKK